MNENLESVIESMEIEVLEIRKKVDEIHTSLYIAWITIIFFTIWGVFKG